MAVTQTVNAWKRRWANARGLKSSRPIIRVGVLDTGSREGDLADRLLSAKIWCCCQRVEMDIDNDYGVLKAFDAMLLVDRPAPTTREDEALQNRQNSYLDLFQKRRIGVLIVTSRPWMYAGSNAGVVCLAPDSSLEKAQGVLAALAHMRPMIREVDKQLSAMQRLSKNLRKRFDETDRELQLAARLQRDFLPHELPGDGPLRFSSMFRPCSWVSGDIFDVFRLDEKHWGFYLADAVGHGVAAGLLTMYIKHAIRPKRIL
ncbi:MAG: PP2C family protein-serine/threonine phosphatase, partial [Phycisphaerae bacterium]